MSADLVLMAIKDPDLDWRLLYDRYRKVEMFGEPDEGEADHGVDADGFWQQTVTLPDGEQYTIHAVTSMDVWFRLFEDGRADRQWVGQVSWLKAGLLEDADRYIPGPVAGVAAAVGNEEPLLLTPARVKHILVAFNRPNHSIYKGGSKGNRYRGVVRARELKRWLEAHVGYHIIVESE